MATLSRSILFGTHPNDENLHNLKLYVSDVDNVIITDIDFNPNADGVFISISKDEWDELVLFVKLEIKINDNGKK